MEIINIKPGDINFHKFSKLPEKLYPSESVRHNHFESINLEFLQCCYVLSINGEPAARAALYNNPNLLYKGLKAACIGNYECVDDIEVAKKIIEFVRQEAKTSGAEFLIGPMNGSTWNDYRFSNHHKHPNFFLEPYHHLYYNQQFIETGFSVISSYSSSIDKKLPCDIPEVLLRERAFEQQGVKIRNIRMDDYEAELKKLYGFLSFALKNNFLYTPISWETFKANYTAAAKIINPEYVLIAEGPEGNVIGFIFSYDDLNNKEEKNLVFKTIVRDASKQWTGLGHVMSNCVIRKVKNKGYQSFIHAFMLEQGSSTGLSKSFMGTIYKHYTLYGLKL